MSIDWTERTIGTSAVCAFSGQVLLGEGSDHCVILRYSDCIVLGWRGRLLLRSRRFARTLAST